MIKDIEVYAEQCVSDSIAVAAYLPDDRCEDMKCLSAEPFNTQKCDTEATAMDMVVVTADIVQVAKGAMPVLRTMGMLDESMEMAHCLHPIQCCCEPDDWWKSFCEVCRDQEEPVDAGVASISLCCFLSMAPSPQSSNKNAPAVTMMKQSAAKIVKLAVQATPAD